MSNAIGRGELWVLLRDAVRHGAWIESNGNLNGWGYERHSAEIDAAASKYADELQRMLNGDITTTETQQ